jgi:mannitol-1-/sugar-/sorbitol-6-phosphatase
VIARSPRAAPAWLTDVRALLLDLDGTLVDSDAAVERAWRRWVEEYGFGDRLEEVGMHGRPAEQTVRLLDPGLDEEGVRERAQRQLSFQYDDREPLERCPGATELLAALERLRLPWAVVTSCDRRLAALRLGAVRIEPPLLVTAEDVEVGKPGPECFLRAAELLEVGIGRCLVVEDSEAGLIAGRRAGARTAALRGLDGDLPIVDLGVLAQLLSG